MQTVYIDTCVVSRLVDRSTERPEVFAALARLIDRKDLEWCVGRPVQQELLRTSDSSKRDALYFIYRLFHELRHVELELHGAVGGAPLGSLPVGFPGWEDPLFSDLKKIFDEEDARQIAYATKTECDVFLTLDAKSILRRVNERTAEIQKLCPNLTFSSPETLYREIFEEEPVTWMNLRTQPGR